MPEESTAQDCFAFQNGAEIIHLSQDAAIRELCTLYWEVDGNNKFVFTVTELAKEYGYPSHTVSLIIKDNCRFVFPEYNCTSCNEPKTFKSRAEFINKDSYLNKDWQCQNCLDEERKEKELEKEDEEVTIRKAVSLDYSHSEDVDIDINKIGFLDSIYLLALLRVGASENFEYIQSRDNFLRALSPTTEMDRGILSYLFSKRLIFMDPDSRIDSFVFDGERVAEFYIFKVQWKLPLGLLKKISGPSLVEKLERKFEEGDWNDGWGGSITAFHGALALEECIQYLNLTLSEHNLEFNAGDKTKQVLASVLRNFSIAQAHNFVWRAVKDAAAFYMRERVTKKHAANMVPGAIQRASEKALTQGWDVKPFGRNFQAPQSAISEIFNFLVLGVGDEGFTTVRPFSSKP